MQFLKKHYKTTTLLFLTLLFVYISHLEDNMKTNIEEVVCWMKVGTQELDKLINYDEQAPCNQQVLTLSPGISGQPVYWIRHEEYKETVDIKYLKYSHL